MTVLASLVSSYGPYLTFTVPGPSSRKRANLRTGVSDGMLIPIESYSESPTAAQGHDVRNHRNIGIMVCLVYHLVTVYLICAGVEVRSGRATGPGTPTDHMRLPCRNSLPRTLF